MQLWTEFRARVKAGAGRVSPEAPIFREFIAAYLPLIGANVGATTLRDYTYVINRHLMPAFASLHISEIKSGVLNAFGARLKAQG